MPIQRFITQDAGRAVDAGRPATGDAVRVFCRNRRRQRAARSIRPLRWAGGLSQEHARLSRLVPRHRPSSAAAIWWKAPQCCHISTVAVPFGACHSTRCGNHNLERLSCLGYRSQHGRPFPVQEHHVPQGHAGCQARQGLHQAHPRTDHCGAAGPARSCRTIPGCAPPSSPRGPPTCRRTRSSARSGAAPEARRRAAYDECATRATARAASPSSSRP